MFIRLSFMVFALTFMGCYGENVEPDEDCVSTYELNLKPIIQSNCIPCHDGSTTGRATLTTLSGLQNNAASVKSKTQSGTMPKSGSLTDEEIALIACWVNNGALDN